jgi:hypothetical protein
VKEQSGLIWISKFPGSNELTDLAPTLREAVEAFITALSAAGAKVSINATFRPPGRAYLMHYAWLIAREHMNPTTVPIMKGVDIEWVHRKTTGAVDRVKSRSSAESMVGSIGYDMVFRAALTSRHTEKRAIDMNISWNEVDLDDNLYNPITDCLP